MRIALLPDDYLPSSTLVHAKMFHELALELVRLGHKPVIITPSHGPQTSKLLIEHIDGVEVWRFRNPKMRGCGKIRRVLSESLISWNAYRAIKNKVSENPFDACLNYSPTIFFGALMKWFKRKHRTYIYLILRDMFPQWVIDEGLISAKSPIAAYFRFFEHLNYKASDVIGLMSQANVDYFTHLNPQYPSLEILRNWADITPFRPSRLSLNIREAHNLEGKVIYFYGGNIGHAQDMGNLIRLAEKMKPYQQAHFLFIGQGDEVDLVLDRKSVLQLDNLTYLPSISQEQYKEVLTQVDVGLFSLAQTHKAHNFPGKLLGYMVQSLPVLGSVNQGNDLLEFINEKKSGLAYINGDDEALFMASLKLLEDEQYRRELGQGAYTVLKQSFSVESAAKQLISRIEETK